MQILFIFNYIIFSLPQSTLKKPQLHADAVPSKLLPTTDDYSQLNADVDVNFIDPNDSTKI